MYVGVISFYCLHFYFDTMARDLGREKSFIEMDTPAIKPQQLQQLEVDVNEAIRKCLPMTPRWVDSASDELKAVSNIFTESSVKTTHAFKCL